MSGSEKKKQFTNVKNKGDFYFTLNNETGTITTNEPLAKSVDGKLMVYLNGVVYNKSKNQLLEGFTNEGSEFAGQLEGSFVIFLIIDNVFYIITDKTNSQKAFYAKINDSWHVSNNIDRLPTGSCEIDIAGLACYVANGNMFNDLTLFKGIKSAQRASIHSFKKLELSISKYWDLQFNYSDLEDFDKAKEEQVLENLLIETFSEIFASTENPSLSLSAGYDARSILGILKTKINAPVLHCFSYDLSSSPKRNSDSALSKKLAEKYDAPHQLINAYDNNLINLLKYNATEGKCLANLCAELNVWHYLKEHESFTDIFVGDQMFGIPDSSLESKEKILDFLSIADPTSIRWLKGLVGDMIYMDMKDALGKLNDDVFEKTKDISKPQDKKDYLFFDQRINHTIMPWRELFPGRIAYVHNPFLHGKLLNFVGEIPPKLRIDKLFFKEVVEKMMPDLFSIKKSTATGNYYNWALEIHKNKKALMAMVESTESRLDKIIPKKEIIDMIKLQPTINWVWHTKKIVKKVIKSIRVRSKIADKLFGLFIGDMENPKTGALNQDRIVLRLLLVRIYLTKVKGI